MPEFTSADAWKLQGAERLWAYNCFDVCMTYELYDAMPRPPIYAMAQRLQAPIMAMMRRGMRVDHLRRKTLFDDLQEDYQELYEILNYVSYQIWGKPLNPASSVQLKAFLYDTLGLKPVLQRKKTDGSASTNREALEILLNSYPKIAAFFDLLLEIRDCKKAMEFLQADLRPDGRFYANFNIAGTETGRLSSSKDNFGYGSNLQNVNKRLREIFIPDPGKILCQTDLQGAESRGVAYLSGDPNYISAVESSDVHTKVAAMVFGIEENREAADQKFYRDMSYRDMAKRGGHSINYYGQPFAMSKNLKIELKVAEDFRLKYFTAFPLIQAWHRAVQFELQTKGKLTTPMGRTRIFLNRLTEDSTLREAIAFVPQSLIADVMDTAIIQVYDAMPQVELLAQVHDALISQLDEKYYSEQLQEMQHHLSVPVKIKTNTMIIPSEAEIGYNWAPKNDNNPNGLQKWKT